MKFRLKTYLALVLSNLLFNVAFAQINGLTGYRWTTIDAKGEVTSRHESSMVVYKDKIYLLGGRGINPVNVFDPKTNTWSAKKETPIEFHHFQAVVYKDAIYVVGAMTGKYPIETPLENVWIYSPENDTWKKGVEIPKNRRRGGAGAALYKDKIYLACGIDFGHTSGTNNLFDEFDPQTGKWKTMTKAPHIRDHFSVIVVEDKLYCIGGRNTSFHLPERFGAFFEQTMPFVDVYDFIEEEWHTMKEILPYPTAAGGLVSLDDKIIYAGGEGEYPVAYNQTCVLDLSSGKWTELSPLNRGRHSGGSVVFENEIYMAAGSPNKGGGNLNTIEVFSPNHHWQNLFNEENLNGWTIFCADDDREKEYWYVQNGEIICDTKGRRDHGYIWLQHDATFDDFELRLKFQSLRENKGNTGLMIRSNYDTTALIESENGKYGWMDGPQVDFDPNIPWRNGFLYDETREYRRWIDPDLPNWKISEEEYAPKKFVHFFEDEGPGWNDLTVICKGTNITTIVNNIIVKEFDGDGIINDEFHQKHGVGMNGHIALQLHKGGSNQLRFKDIEILKLE